MNETQNEKVAQVFACPTCGNRDMDSLEWIDDKTIMMKPKRLARTPMTMNAIFDLVECGACGTVYTPNKE